MDFWSSVVFFEAEPHLFNRIYVMHSENYVGRLFFCKKEVYQKMLYSDNPHSDYQDMPKTLVFAWNYKDTFEQPWEEL